MSHISCDTSGHHAQPNHMRCADIAYTASCQTPTPPTRATKRVCSVMHTCKKVTKSPVLSTHRCNLCQSAPPLICSLGRPPPANPAKYWCRVDVVYRHVRPPHQAAAVATGCGGQWPSDGIGSRQWGGGGGIGVGGIVSDVRPFWLLLGRLQTRRGGPQSGLCCDR